MGIIKERAWKGEMLATAEEYNYEVNSLPLPTNIKDTIK